MYLYFLSQPLSEQPSMSVRCHQNHKYICRSCQLKRRILPLANRRPAHRFGCRRFATAAKARQPSLDNPDVRLPHSACLGHGLHETTALVVRAKVSPSCECPAPSRMSQALMAANSPTDKVNDSRSHEYFGCERGAQTVG